MSVLIPIVITAIAATLAYIEWERSADWSLMPGLAVVAAGLVSGTSWVVWLLMVIL